MLSEYLRKKEEKQMANRPTTNEVGGAIYPRTNPTTLVNSDEQAPIYPAATSQPPPPFNVQSDDLNIYPQLPRKTVPAEPVIEDAYPINGEENYTAPRNLEGVDTSKGTYPTVTPKSRLEQKREERADIADQPVVDNDKGFWKKFGAVGREALLGIAENGGRGGIGGTIGAAIGGAGRNLIYPKIDEERKKQQDLAQIDQELGVLEQQRNNDLNAQYKQTQIGNIDEDNARQRDQMALREKMSKEKLAAQIESETVKFNRRLELLNRQADIKSGEAKIYTDEDGKLFKQFLKADSTGKFRDPEPIDADGDGQQDTDPNKMTYDVFDPVSGLTVKVKGNAIYSAGATIRQGDANREQQANIQNANFDFQAQKTNVANSISYNKQVVDLAGKIAQTTGKVLENKAEVDNVQIQLNGATQKVNSINPQTNPDEYNQAIDEMNALSGKLIELVGKTQAGQQALGQLQSQGISRPNIIKAPKVNAVRVGKLPSAVSEETFRQQLKTNRVDPNLYDAYIAKAKQDGVIK